MVAKKRQFVLVLQLDGEIKDVLTLKGVKQLWAERRYVVMQDIDEDYNPDVYELVSGRLVFVGRLSEV